MKKTIVFLFFSFLTFSQNRITSNFILIQHTLDYNITEFEDGFLIPNETKDLDKIISYALTDIRYFLSFMVYGFDFTLYPKNTVISQRQSFSFNIKKEIKAGDEGYKTLKLNQDENGIDIQSIYYLDDIQNDIINSYNSSNVVEIVGKSSYNIYGQKQNIIKNSFKSALEYAISNEVERRYKNIPKKVSGVALISSFPRFYTKDGAFYCTVKIKLKPMSVSNVVIN